MGSTPKDYVLKPGELDNPVLWAAFVDIQDLPLSSDFYVDQIYGDGKKSARLKSYGMEEDLTHYVGTRGGTPMHHDKGYTRYSCQLTVRNDGYRLRGLRDVEYPKIQPGTIICLDTHSPHQLCKDLRFKKRGLWKVSIVIDSPTPMTQEEAIPLLLARASRDPHVAVQVSRNKRTKR